LDQLFQNSKLLAEFDDLLSSRDAATAKPSKEALQYRTAHALADIDKPRCPKLKNATATAYEDL